MLTLIRKTSIPSGSTPWDAWQQSTDYSSNGDALSQQEFASSSICSDAFWPTSSLAGTRSTSLNRMLTSTSPRTRLVWPTGRLTPRCRLTAPTWYALEKC